MAALHGMDPLTYLRLDDRTRLVISAVLRRAQQLRVAERQNFTEVLAAHLRLR